MHASRSFRWLELLPLAMLFAACAALYRWNIDFPLVLHPDEPRKLVLLLNEKWEFFHPRLMIEVIQPFLGNATDYFHVAVAGRTVNAMVGALIPLATYAAARRFLSAMPALLAAVLVGLSPILALHAHYLKEDMVFTLCSTLALWAMLGCARTPSRREVLVLGVCLGLAFASKYVGAMWFVLVALLARRGHLELTARQFVLAATVGLAVFAAVNHDAFPHLGTFLQNAGYEINHGVAGHKLRLYPFLTLGVHHLTHSLAPGLTWPVTLAALFALAWAWKVHRGEPALQVVVAFVVFYYLLIELSPTKPYQNAIRYALPLVPGLAILLAWGAARLSAEFRHAVVAGALILLGCMGADAVQLVRHINHDSRQDVQQILAGLDGNIVLDRVLGLEGRGSETDIHSREPGTDPLAFLPPDTDYYVTSGYQYGRYLDAMDLPFQGEHVYRIAQRYKALMTYPYLEIGPRYRTLAFADPVFRIIDLRGARNKGR